MVSLGFWAHTLAPTVAAPLIVACALFMQNLDSSVISTARLMAATNQAGTGAELSVIAAAVIGGTSFAGGIGTIPGAILGALVIQSLVSGMQLLGFDNPTQDIAVGVVLVAAVGVDTVLRKRAS